MYFALDQAEGNAETVVQRATAHWRKPLTNLRMTYFYEKQLNKENVVIVFYFEFINSENINTMGKFYDMTLNMWICLQ